MKFEELQKDFTFASFWQFCPHLFHPLKHHVAMPVKFGSFVPGFTIRFMDQI